MNTKITALKKKIELKEKQLKSKQELIIRSKEAVKKIKCEIELLKNELAKEEMLEMTELMSKNHLSIDDVKEAISSGKIAGNSKPLDEDTESVSKKFEEINNSNKDKEEQTDAE